MFSIVILMATVSLEQREYCRYTEISAEIDRHGIISASPRLYPACANNCRH